MIETTIKEYLLSIGFSDEGLCPVCGGRALLFKKNNVVVKVRIDQFGVEYTNGTFMVEGKNDSGRTIVPTRGYKTNIIMVLKDLGV